ncbi:hypothetical protein [Nocardioides nitrophenolicus]|uniref:hypothetical protein n=1 Tax=Nocardioides nitrophenolicus TaxID=60489 RepID=UPI00195B2CBF|nr:hypothetical protein [Nocardioides nitrophenolicus]MBM7519735.1 hypothetical protein [Nocardioides nitrophenolicus]
MAQVSVGRVGGDVVVPGDVCVKTGVPTRQRVTISGATVPSWVHALIVFSFLAWLIAQSNSQRRYRVEVAFQHAAWDRWNRLRRLAWALGTGGLVAAFWASTSGVPHGLAFLALTAGGFVLGLGNALVHTVGFRQQDDLLVMTRVHPDAVAAIRAARIASQP